MSLDTPQDKAYASNQDQGVDHTPQKKQRPPGVISLRIVIEVSILAVLAMGWWVYVNHSDWPTTLYHSVLLALLLIVPIGLLLRIDAMRRVLITILLFSLVGQLLVLIIPLFSAMDTSSQQVNTQDEYGAVMRITLFGLSTGLIIWMIEVLHNEKTKALMKRSTPHTPKQAKSRPRFQPLPFGMLRSERNQP